MDDRLQEFTTSLLYLSLLLVWAIMATFEFWWNDCSCVFVYIKFYYVIYLSIYAQLNYKFELPVEKLGFSSIAALVNSISDVVKKVIQGGACVCVVYVHVCVYVCYFCYLQVSCL